MAFFIQVISRFEVLAFFYLLLLTNVIALCVFMYRTKRYTKKPILIASLLLLLSFGGVGKSVHDLSQIPRVLYSQPGKADKIFKRSGAMHVVFSAPVKYDELAIHTNPPLEIIVKKNGRLGDVLPYGTSLTIIPKTTLPPGEHIMVYFANIKGLLTKSHGGEQLIEGDVEDPEVSAIDPPDNSSKVVTSQEVTVAFSSSVFASSEWTVKSEPAHKLSILYIDDKTLKIKPDEPFRQGTQYILSLIHTPVIAARADGTVQRQLDPRTKATIHLSVVKPANIASFTPSGNAVNPGEPIVIMFEEPVEQVSLKDFIHLGPDVAFNTVLEDGDKKLTVQPAKLEKDTKYSVTLNKGLLTKNRGTLEEDAIFEFETAGAITVTDVSPADQSGNVAIDTGVKITFDQKVPESIKDHISFTPSVEGTYSVSDNIVEFKPKNNFNHEVKYAIRIAKDAPSLYGLPSVAEKTIAFTTQPDQVILQVPYYRQEGLFTCNISAARMLLAYRGISVTEQDLINKIGTAGRRGSGNPNTGHVSDFGTFWDAVMKGAQQYRGAHLITSGNLTDLLKEVKKGNPAMTWGQNGWSDPHSISWTASDGAYINAINGMHSVIVTGYIGSVENPRQIWVNDPWRGQYSMDTNEFLRRWSYYKMAMVVE